MQLVISFLKVLLGLYSLTGAGYMMGHYADLASPAALQALPAIFWLALGMVQGLSALALIASVFRRFRGLTRPAAGTLAAITLSGAALYSAYVGLPGILWALIPAALFLFIAYSKPNFS